MDQYDLRHLFNAFDRALGIGRAANDPKRLKSSQFQLTKLDKNICTFEHLELPSIRVKFDCKTGRIVP